MSSSISQPENRSVVCHTGLLPAADPVLRNQRMTVSIVPPDTPSALASLRGTSRPVTRRVDELRPHSGFIRHKLAASIDKLSALATRGETAFQEPLLITQNGTILDGHARWELARRQGRHTLDCLEREMTEEDALLHLLQNHRGSAGLNHFTRILLALDLEPWFKMQARSNQQRGGLMKGSSNSTQAERLDVRAKIASAAGVSLGNVTKVSSSSSTHIPRSWKLCAVGRYGSTEHGDGAAINPKSSALSWNGSGPESGSTRPFMTYFPGTSRCPIPR